MASSIIHNDIKKVVGLLVNAVHLVKSPANRKKFFLIKGEQKMNLDELKVKLKEEKYSDDEIDFIISNDELTSILLSDENSKKALDVLREGLRLSIKDIENALEGETITDITSKMIKPLEIFTSFLSVGEPKPEDKSEPESEDKSEPEPKPKSENDPDEELDNSVSELAEEISGLAEDTAELAEEIIE